MTTATTTTKADQLRAEAAQHEQDAHDSFDRCDTDGFVTQWASGVNAQQKRLQASIEERGGMWEFHGLADLDGNLVPAKLIETRYGMSWGIFASAEQANTYNGKVIQWVTAFPARESTMTKKGYKEVMVEAPAVADLHGTNACTVTAYARRTGPAFDPNATILD